MKEEKRRRREEGRKKEKDKKKEGGIGGIGEREVTGPTESVEPMGGTEETGMTGGIGGAEVTGSTGSVELMDGTGETGMTGGIEVTGSTGSVESMGGMEVNGLMGVVLSTGGITGSTEEVGPTEVTERGGTEEWPCLATGAVGGRGCALQQYKKSYNRRRRKGNSSTRSGIHEELSGGVQLAVPTYASSSSYLLYSVSRSNLLFRLSVEDG